MTPQNKVFIKSHVCLTALGNSLTESAAKIAEGISGIRNLREQEIFPPNFAVQLGAPVQVETKNIFNKLKSLLSIRYNRALWLFSEKIAELNKSEGPFDFVIFSYARIPTQFLANVDFQRIQPGLDSNYIPKLLLSNAGIDMNPESIIFMKSACSSSIVMLNAAIRRLEKKRGAKALVISIENEICGENLIELDKLGATTHATSPALGCIPFNKRRTGFVKGEALVALVLKSVHPNSEENSTNIYLRSGHTYADCHNLTDSQSDGYHAIRCLKQTLQEFSIENLSAICAHGNSTILNDKIEIKIFSEFLKQRKHPLPVYCLKPYIGHTLDSAGLIEVLISTELMGRNFLPSLTREADEEGIENFYFPTSKNNLELNLLCKFSIGLAGINSALLIEKTKQ